VNGSNSRRIANQMFGQLPLLMALGINFGIVPLLFLQTAYYQSFYTATILIAWHWIAVIPILIVGYYSLYIAAYSRKNTFSIRAVGAGLLAFVCLAAIGILITNGLTLMVRSDLWTNLMEKTNHFGATTGLANNMRDEAVWIRLATMFALGLMTTAVWGQLLPFFPAGEYESAEAEAKYRRWCAGLSQFLSIFAAVILVAVEGLIKQPTAAEHVKIMYPYFGFVLFPVFLTVILCFVSLWQRTFGIIAVAVHFLTLAGFGVVRQVGQNTGVVSFVDVSKIPEQVQWSPLISFLIIFVLGLGVIAWMVKQCFKAELRA
jgi:hypothetical protein